MNLPSTVIRLARRVRDRLLDPPDLTEKAIAIEFIVVVYPDYTARVTATKLSGAKPEEIQNIANAGIAIMLTWARNQGVNLHLNPTNPEAPPPKPPKPAPKPVGPVLRGVRP